MPRFINIFLLFLVVPALAHADGFDSMMPKPLRLDRHEGKQALVFGLRVHIPKKSPARVREIAEVFAYELKKQTSLACTLADSNAIEPGAITFILRPSSDTSAAVSESYALEVNDKGIVIAAATTQGLLWGVQTLLQGIESENGRHFVRHAFIIDQPERVWRGLMLEPTSSFLALDYIRSTIRVMSAYKMNILHLHLMDDSGAVYETKVFPKCNRPGVRAKQFYTQDELRELVRYAARYGIEVVPEVDFPGHSAGQVTAYPGLDCEGKPRGKREAILCPGKTFTWEFLEKIIAELTSVFPSRHIHLGGDEPFAIKRWQTCPDCQARMKAKGVTTLEAFYHTFINDINDIAKRHGRRAIVWNDAIHPGVEPMPAKDIIIHAWRRGRHNPNNPTASNPHDLAAGGYAIINSSHVPMYLKEPIPLSAVKDWDATLFLKGKGTVIPDAPKERYVKLPPNAIILGGQACKWTTALGTHEVREKSTYPRLQCVAETLWAEGRAGDLADFEARWRAHELLLFGRFGVSPDYKHPAVPLFVNAKPQAKPLRSAEKYDNFILSFELDTKTSVAFTGITVRDGFKVGVTPPPGTKGVLQRKLHGLQGWNTYELIVRGPVITLAIGDRVAWSVDNADTTSGHITVQPADGVERFRNFAIRRLD